MPEPERRSDTHYVRDDPIKTLREDRLGLATEVRALAEVICLREPGPPLAIGLFGVLTRRNAVGILLGIELMLNAVNINLVAFARFRGDIGGLVFTMLTIAITVAEVAVGLAIVIAIFVSQGASRRATACLSGTRLAKQICA